MLEYSRIRDYSAVSKLKWVAITAAVFGSCGVISAATIFSLYLAPLFSPSLAAMGRPGGIDYLLINIGYALLEGWLAASAIAFLRGYPMRRQIAVAAWVLLFAHTASAVYSHIKYPNSNSVFQAIESIADTTNFIKFNLPLPLIILFFGQRQTALRLSELSTPVAFAAEAPQPGRTPDSP